MINVACTVRRCIFLQILLIVSVIYFSVQTKLYTEDWIGLKALDDAGRVKFISVAGNHLGISKADMKKYVVPYLESKLSTGFYSNHEFSRGRKFMPHPKEGSLSYVIINGSASYTWPSSIWSFVGSLLGLNEDQQLHQT